VGIVRRFSSSVVQCFELWKGGQFHALIPTHWTRAVGWKSEHQNREPRATHIERLPLYNCHRFRSGVEVTLYICIYVRFDVCLIARLAHCIYDTLANCPLAKTMLLAESQQVDLSASSANDQWPQSLYLWINITHLYWKTCILNRYI